MARINNAITWGSGFNISAAEPIDSRTRVEFESDLTLAATWPSDTAPVFSGLTVSVIETGDVWVLKDPTYYNEKSSRGWVKVGRNAIDDNTVSLDTTWSSSKIASIVVGGVRLEVVSELPESGDSSTIYLVPAESGNTYDGSGYTNYYDEFIYINDSWELIGTTQIDLTNYYTKDEVEELLAEKQDLVEVSVQDVLDFLNEED